ncbi:hypothetical protein [Terrimonas alba]|uniref:hypothetical protein n=1 Tax=Terrimonas alba TaxID=3349636 RepID=UPI0035F4DD09
MKKIIIMLAVTISSFTAFASDENVNSTVLSSFNKEFAGAKDVQWTTTSNYYKASFVFNDQVVSAFYQLDGELIATSRNISSLELPINLQTSLKKNYNSYWISDLFEISNNEGTSYYITLDKADSKVVLKSNGNGKWDVFKKATKI